VTLEPIGLITILFGLACVAFGPAVGTPVFTCFTLLGAAAASILSAVGGASIQPAHLLLLFLFVDLILRPGLMRESLRALRLPQAGSWLLLTVAYGVATAIILPRLFAGATYVFTPARSDSGTVSVLTMPLAPGSANLTQSVYFIGDLICFLIIATHAARRDAARQITRTMMLCGILNLAFAGLDLATYYTNTAELLAFIRNSSYRMLDDVETAGLKRIVGSFTEAASFAYVTLGLLAFNLRLWSDGIVPRVTGPIALLSLVAILFATSSTGYVGLGVVLSLQAFAAVRRLLGRRAAPNTVALLALAPVLAAVCVAGIALEPTLRASVSDLIDTTLFNKLSSDSGIERGAWNRQALTAIADTHWLGAGIGSLRASSWLIAVPANIGAVGSALYGCFLLAVFLRRDPDDDPLVAALRAAGKHACIAQIAAASIAGAFIDLGLNFFLYAGIVCGLKAIPQAVPAMRFAGGPAGNDRPVPRRPVPPQPLPVRPEAGLQPARLHP
jgi:hypothetical protein